MILEIDQDDLQDRSLQYYCVVLLNADQLSTPSLASSVRAPEREVIELIDLLTTDADRRS